MAQMYCISRASLARCPCATGCMCCHHPFFIQSMCVCTPPPFPPLTLTHFTHGYVCRDAHGLLGVHYAAMGGCVPVLSWVVGKPAPDDASSTSSSSGDSWLLCRDGSGRTPLHIAASCGRLPAVQFLIASSVKDSLLTCVDNCGRSALHSATLSGCEDSVSIVEALLSGGAAANVVDSSGQSPLALARDVGNVEVIARLVAAVSPPPLVVIISLTLEPSSEEVKLNWSLPRPLFACVPPIIGFQVHMAHHVRGMPMPSGPSVSPTDKRFDMSATAAAVTSDGKGSGAGEPLFSATLPAPPPSSDGTNLIRIRCCNGAGWGPFCAFVPLV